jgi:signal transduction histidine kinase
VRVSAPVARRLVGLAALAGSTLVATLLGLAVAVLVHGSVPDASAAVPVIVGMLAAVVIGTLSAPVLREAIRNAVPSASRAPSEVSRRIADAATQRLPLDELLDRAAEALAGSLDSSRVEIWLAVEDASGRRLSRSASLGGGTGSVSFSPKDLAVAARIAVVGEGWARRWLPQLLAPEESADAQPAPLRIGAITDAGELLGLVVVGRAPGAVPYERAEDEALKAACQLLAAVLRNRALTMALEASLADLQHTNIELQASRTRIVTAADAERRRIERDLHDGAQQHLLALAVTVGLLKQMVKDAEPADEIEAVLDQLGGDVRTAVQQIRELAQGIYPALLMDSGLGPALRSVAGRSPLRTVVRTDGLRRHPPNLEAAVYFCCIEAMQNAAKHAPGAELTVDLVEADGVLTATVRDNGPGFDTTAPTTGMGRTTMADRVGALGGTVRWESTPGTGTAVIVEVPT